jgi:hypothetical protein
MDGVCYNIKLDLQEVGWVEEPWIGLIWLKIGTALLTCNETYGYIKYANFLDWLRNAYLLHGVTNYVRSKMVFSS